MRANIRIGRAIALLIVISVLLTMCIISLQSCAAMGGKRMAEMTPKERATQIMSVYNDQYELYLREAKVVEAKEANIDNLTEEEKVKLEAKKSAMREKKKLMKELYPYIGIYNGYAERGEFAPIDVEMAVMSIMDKLLGL